ncbi:hypothetical protein Tco_0852394 [Tanacetum coccineum]
MSSFRQTLRQKEPRIFVFTVTKATTTNVKHEIPNSTIEPTAIPLTKTTNKPNPHKNLSSQHLLVKAELNSVAKNLKKSSQAPKGVLVGLKVGFKRVKQAYRPVSSKPTANTSGNKKNDVEPTKKITNLNLFDVLNSIENDVDLGTNGGTSNLVTKEPNSSGSYNTACFQFNIGAASKDLVLLIKIDENKLSH